MTSRSISTATIPGGIGNANTNGTSTTNTNINTTMNTHTHTNASSNGSTTSNPHFSSQESLDSDVTPTALFRGNSFDSADSEESHMNVNVDVDANVDLDLDLDVSTSTSTNTSVEVNSDGVTASLGVNIMTSNNINNSMESNHTKTATDIHSLRPPASNLASTTFNSQQGLGSHSNSHPQPLRDPPRSHYNSFLDNHNKQHPLQDQDHTMQQQIQQQRHDSPLSNAKGKEAAAVLFPPTPPTPSHQQQSYNYRPSQSISSPLILKENHNQQNHNRNVGAGTTNISTNMNMNMTNSNLNTSMNSNNSTCTGMTNDTDTVLTEVMGMATDEDSFDTISPLPSSPSSNLHPHSNLNLNSNFHSSSGSNGSSGSGSVSHLHMHTHIKKIPSSNPRKRTSSDRKKAKSRRDNGGGSIGSINGHGPDLNLKDKQPPLTLLPRSMMSSGSNSSSGNGIGIGHRDGGVFSPTMSIPSTVRKEKLNHHHHHQYGHGHGNYHNLASFRTYRPSIESCHSFDSHDSNNTSASMTSMSTIEGQIQQQQHHQQQVQQQQPQQQLLIDINHNAHSNSHSNSIPNPPGLSSFTFTGVGSPIEEEEEDSSSPFFYNVKKPKRLDERRKRLGMGLGLKWVEDGAGFMDMNMEGRIRIMEGGDSGMSGTTANATSTNNESGNIDDNHMNRIRRLNLDSEMDCNSSCDNGDGNTNGAATASAPKDDENDLDHERNGNQDDHDLTITNTSVDDSMRSDVNDSGDMTMNTEFNEFIGGGGSIGDRHHHPRDAMESKPEQFMLHINRNADFDLYSPDPTHNDGKKEASQNDDKISPADVTEFKDDLRPPAFSSPAMPLSKSAAILSTLQSSSSSTSTDTSTDRNTEFLFARRENNINSHREKYEMNHTHDNDNDIVPPPDTFSSPPPFLKKGLHDPPSPFRMGRRPSNLRLPPTTPMVPQKNMRRMRGRDDYDDGCSSPVHHQNGFPYPPVNNRHVSNRRNKNHHGYESNRAAPEEKSRFMEDFDITGTLGEGSFGTVYKCRSRVDDRFYAVKAARRRAKGRADRDRMLKEVYALAKLSDVADTTAFHIVRYHQAWMEEDRLHIVTELCTSTLQMEMRSGRFHGNNKRSYKLLREMLLALRLIHHHGLVHLDIKPENIFVREDTFKLGDFGLVSKVSVKDDVEEGDSRYMCMDLLSGNHSDLTKCDIFSLGITMYEIALEHALPVDGQEWQDLRAGKLSDKLHAQPDLQTFIKSMMNPDANGRPNAAELLTRRQLLSEEQKRLIHEQNKVREANMALAFQEQRFRKISPKRGLTRSNTCPR